MCMYLLLSLLMFAYVVAACCCCRCALSLFGVCGRCLRLCVVRPSCCRRGCLLSVLLVFVVLDVFC